MAGKKTFDVESALDQAVILFWRQGYEATSLPDLVDAMGIGRQSVYDTFGTKHELFLVALKRYCEVHAGALLEPMESDGATLDDIRVYMNANLSSYLSKVGGRGCFMVNSVMEMADRDPATRRFVSRFQNRMEFAFRNAIACAIKQGSLPKTVSPERLARRLLAVTLGLPALVKSGASRNTMRDLIEDTIASLPYGIKSA